MGVPAVVVKREEKATPLSIIVAITDHSQIDLLARALLAQAAPVAGDEILVADGVRNLRIRRRLRSLDGATWDRLGIRLIDADRPARAHVLNAALREARHELIVFLGDDFVPTPTWLAAHRGLHTSRPEPTVVGIGPAVFPKHLRRSAFRRWLEDKGSLYGAPFVGPTELPPAGFFYGANTSIKRTLLLAAGNFDEAFPYDTTDDLELGIRLRRLGAETVFLREALALHEHRVGFLTRCAQMWRAGESAAIFELRQPAEPVLLPDCNTDVGTHQRRALGAGLRALAGRGVRWREEFWKNALAAVFLEGYARAKRRLAARGGEAMLGPRPILSPASMLRSAILVGRHQRRERSWTVSPDGKVCAAGIDLLETADGLGDVQVKNSSDSCFLARNPLGAAQAYFRIERPHNLGNFAVEIEIEILTDVGDEIRLEYDSTDSGVRVDPRLPGAYKPTVPQRLDPDGLWKTLRFEIRDGRYCGAINGADFRVVSSRPQGVPLSLRRVRVFPLPQEASTSAAAPPAAAITELLAFAEAPDPQVTIVIPVWNCLDLTVQCLQALRANTDDAYEIVVVDDGSTDGTLEAMRSIPGIQLVSYGANRGFAHACNAGAAIARGRFVVFLNNDTIPQQGWLGPMVAAMDRDPRIGIVGSRLLYPGSEHVQHAGVEFADDGRPYHRFQFQPADTPGIDVNCLVPAVTAACLLTRREVLERCGAFDEAFRNGYEDIDFCLRVREAGYQILYCAESILLHHESATAGRLDRGQGDANLALLCGRWQERLSEGLRFVEGKPADTSPCAPKASRRRLPEDLD